MTGLLLPCSDDKRDHLRVHDHPFEPGGYVLAVMQDAGEETMSAVLTPAEARRLRDWLTQWLERYGDTP